MDFEEIKKSLWHAFNVLDDSNEVKKTRVRVLTNNIGQVLGVEHAETAWDRITEDVINFDLFVKILRSSLLVGIDKNTDPRVITLRAELDNLCWMLCEKSYLKSVKGDATHNSKDDDNKEKNDEKKKREFTKTDLFKLWKIFNFLCERSADGLVLTPLRIDIEEADKVACEICSNLGLPAPRIGSRSPTGLDDGSFLMDFCQFVSYQADLVAVEESNEVISHGIAEVHCQIISDVVRKGYMVKFGNKVTAWKDRWFVLTASALRYYVSSEERDLKGSIVLCPECFTQTFPDKPGGKQHRFKLHTPNKQYELSTPDLKSKNMWMADIKRVVSHIGCRKESLQQVAWKERKKEREERRRRTAEEELRRCAEKEAMKERERQLEELRKQRERDQAEKEEKERLLELEKQDRMAEEERRKKEIDELLEQKRLEIEAERQKCLETEIRLKSEREELMKSNQEALDAERMERERLMEEEAALEKEKQALKERLKELELAKGMLEKAVEEERALKRDEEIVRNLQAKILEDEFAKRAELERLRDEQKKQLMEEQLTRQELEEAHNRQEQELRQKQEQLESLISEREEADQKWKDASDRLKQAELDRLHLEARMKLKEMSSSVSLSKPLPTPDPNPFVTHRGLGAFVESDFHTSHHSPSKNSHNANNGDHPPSDNDKIQNGLCHRTETIAGNEGDDQLS